MTRLPIRLSCTALLLACGLLGATTAFAGPTENKALVRQALHAAFVLRDPAAIERYFAEDYQQHNPQVADGRTGLIDAVKSMPPFITETGAMVAEGDLVVVHSRITGLGPTPMIVFDLFRVNNGKVAEHWDVLAPEVPATSSKSGRPMLSPARP